MKALSDKSVLMVCAGLMAIVALLFGACDKLAAMSGAIVLCGLALVFAFVDRISEFKASATGIEAKLRDAVMRAHVTIDELRSLAAVLSKQQIGAIVRSSRIGSPDYREQAQAIDSILAVLRELEVSDAEIKGCLEVARRYAIFDYPSKIIGNTAMVDTDLKREWTQVRPKLEDPPFPPDDLEALLSKHGELTPTRLELLEDYRYYLSKFSHRRPDVWFSLWHK